MKGYIYKITIDTKNYIGSCRNIKERLKTHINRSTEEKFNHLKLYKNFMCFNLNIIETSENISDKDLKILEQKYIDELDTINNGLNHTRSFLSAEEFRKQNNKISKTYRINHPEKCNEMLKQNRKNHKLNQTFRCECCDYNFGCNRDLQRHFESKSHKKNISL